MSKNSGNKVAVETWKTPEGNKIRKVAIRASNGQFLGATNYRGSVIEHITVFRINVTSN